MKTIRELLSHPNYPLALHVQGVLNQIDLFLQEKEVSFPNMNELKEVAILIGVFHDIGKATSYFQSYIRNEDDAPSSLKNHSLLSAFLLYPFMKQELDGQLSDERLFILAFLIVKRHHGQLNNWLEEWKQFHEEEKEVLLKQIESIDFSLLNNTFQSLPYYKSLSKEQCKAWIEQLYKESRKIRRIIMKHNNTEDSLTLYIQYLFLFSLLIDADKSEAGILQRHSFPKRKNVSDQIVKNFKNKQQWAKSSLNLLREKAFLEVDQFSIDVHQYFYSLQLPTGLGKTFASIQFALNIRATLEKEKGIKPRIIYSLPFLSVIDQTEHVIETIFKENKIKVDQSLVIAHHHLADLQYATYEEESIQAYEYNAAKLLIEGWNAEIILTTFIQLFQTIFSNKNRSLRKFHRLANAIIIIDEVQAIPHKYWLVIRETLKALAEHLGCYFVFSSATTPAIFPQEDMVQIVDPKEYYDVLSRVDLYPDITPRTISEFVESLQIDESKSYLFILNTIGSAKEFYEQIIEKVDSHEVTFLSTHIPPIERLKRIQDMKQKHYRIAVSTQLVEAGVDIDFDVVYRDLAPLDSIHQAAGRCNRHGTHKGEVHVIQLTDGRRSYASYIYDMIRLHVTKELLSQQQKITEKEFFQSIDTYFQQLSKKIANKESLALLRGMKTLFFNGEGEKDRIPVSHFQLIEEQQERMEVFIELDEQAKHFFQTYEHILGIQNRWEQQEAFAKLKSSFHKYVISIPLKTDNKPPIRSGIGYVGNDQLDDFYDPILGYKTKNIGFIW